MQYMKLNNLTRVLTICVIIFKSVVCMAQTDSICHDNTIISDSIPFVADNELGKSAPLRVPALISSNLSNLLFPVRLSVSVL